MTAKPATPAMPAKSPKDPAAPLSVGIRILVIAVSSIVAVALIMAILVFFSGKTDAELKTKSVPQVNEFAAEQIEGVEGLLEISDFTLEDSEGKVFDEKPRNDLRAQRAVAAQFLADLPSADDAAPKQQAVDRLLSVEDQFGELFESIRLVQVAMKQYEDAH